MKKIITTLVIGATAIVGTAADADAGNPTCAGTLGEPWTNHGDHVRWDYVSDGDGNVVGARGGPAHLAARPGGPAPGASFCLQQAQSPGLHF